MNFVAKQVLVENIFHQQQCRTGFYLVVSLRYLFIGVLRQVFEVMSRPLV